MLHLELFSLIFNDHCLKTEFLEEEITVYAAFGLPYLLVTQ